jgi:2-polyprenyl-3-methyl-5-hydroxy-6-metoxy-1,4-benzoquinol methylase
MADVAKSVHGVDIDKESITCAKKLYPGLKFGRFDLSVDFPDINFDLCVSFETIEHLESPERFLQNVHEHCEEFLFSIPLNNPSKFHKNVWNKYQVQKMINKYWPKGTNWYHQTGINFHEGMEDATFLIGYTTR